MKFTRSTFALSALGAALLAAGAFTAPAALAAEPGKLLIWYSTDGAKGMQKIGAEFTAKTGIPVTVEAPEDGPGKFQQAAAGGTGPDIWIWAHDRAGEWPLHPSAPLAGMA